VVPSVGVNVSVEPQSALEFDAITDTFAAKLVVKNEGPDNIGPGALFAVALDDGSLLYPDAIEGLDAVQGLADGAEAPVTLMVEVPAGTEPTALIFQPDVNGVESVTLPIKVVGAAVGDTPTATATTPTQSPTPTDDSDVVIPPSPTPVMGPG
jgi:hypothetical protein